MIQLPRNQHITYQLQHRKCGKASCSTCRNGQGHGPYWYAYWREGSRLRSGYIGKDHPDEEPAMLQQSKTNRHDKRGAYAMATAEEATPALI